MVEPSSTGLAGWHRHELRAIPSVCAHADVTSFGRIAWVGATDVGHPAARLDTAFLELPGILANLRRS